MQIRNKILDVDGVSKHTSLSKNTIYKKVCLNEIPFHKIGGRTLFHADEIDQWILNNGKMVEKLPEIKFI